MKISNVILIMAPMVLLFSLPWVHHFAFANIRLAIPDLSVDAAHWAVIIMSVGFCWAFGMALSLRN